VAANWDAQHDAFKASNHFAGGNRKDKFPWEFNQVGAKTSEAYGEVYRQGTAKPAAPGPRMAKPAEARRPKPKSTAAVWGKTKEQEAMEAHRDGLDVKAEAAKLAEFNQSMIKDRHDGHARTDQSDHFLGASMNVVDDDTGPVHGCRHVKPSNHALVDHLSGMGMTVSASAAESDFGLHGRKHVTSIQKDHFVGVTMELDGTGGPRPEGIGHVALVKSHAQEDHLQGIASVKEGVGGSDLFTAAGAASELKHLGHTADKTKMASHDHFARGQMTMDQNAAKGEMMELMSASGTGSEHKGYAATSAGNVDHFSAGAGMTMDITKPQTYVAHKRYGACHAHAAHDHFSAGAGMVMEQDMARGETMDLLSSSGMSSGLGDHHKGHVASVGSNAQASHLKHFATLTDDAGGEGLFATSSDSGVTNQMKHLGHVGDNTVSHDHFAAGKMTMDQGAAKGEMMDLVSAQGYANAHKGHTTGAVDHFAGVSMVMDAAKEDAHESYKRAGYDFGHESAHDHFAHGGMTMDESAARTEMMELQSFQGSGSVHKSGPHGKDHFSSGGGMVFNEKAAADASRGQDVRYGWTA